MSPRPNIDLREGARRATRITNRVRWLALTVVGACVAPVTTPPPPVSVWKPLESLPSESGEVQTLERESTVAALPPITLETAIQRALTHERSLADTRSEWQSAQISVRSAEAEFELQILPSGALAAGEGGNAAFDYALRFERKFESGSTLAATPRVTHVGGEWNSALGSEFVQPLLLGRDREFVRDGLDSAEFGARAARRALYLAEVRTVVNTVAAVYQIIDQRESVRLFEESAARLAAHVEATRARERAGLSSSIDVLRATLQESQAREALSNARAGLEEAQDALRIELALELDTPLEVDAPLEWRAVRLSEADAVELALAQRVEPLQAADNMREAQRASRVAGHAIMPQLDLVLAYARRGTADDFGGSTKLDDDLFSVSLVTSGDAMRTVERAFHAQSLVDVDVARRDLDLVRDAVARDARSALRNLVRLERQIEIGREQVQKSHSKLEVARVKFRHGLAGNFDLIEAEGEVRQAEVSLLGAVVDYVVGTWVLRAALGSLLEHSEDEA